MSDPTIPAALRGSSLEVTIKALDEVYARADASMGRFRLASGFSCIPGCGECCKGFEPEIRPAEAAYLAAWLLGSGAGKLGLLERDDGSGTCPFFDAEDPHHCQVYPARFLVCRLFGFCAMRDKEGELDFSLCFALAGSGKHHKKRWRAEDLAWVYGVLPPPHGGLRGAGGGDRAGWDRPTRAGAEGDGRGPRQGRASAEDGRVGGRRRRVRPGRQERVAWRWGREPGGNRGRRS